MEKGTGGGICLVVSLTSRHTIVSILYSKVINVPRKVFYLNSHLPPATELLDFPFLPSFFHSPLRKVIFSLTFTWTYQVSFENESVNFTMRCVRQHERRLRVVNEHRKMGLSVSKPLWLKWRLYRMSKRVYN